MKIKNNIFLVLLFLTVSVVFGQEVFSFYVEIPDINKIPVVTHSKNGVRMTYFKTQNRGLDKLVNSYKIYNCKKVFSNSNKSSLQNIYLIECNDLKLMNQLYDKFKQFYPRVEKANGEPLFIPNDYGSTGGYIVSDQVELDYIRAPEAWDITTGSIDIKIGVADVNFAVNHQDLVGTMDVVVNVSNNTLVGDDHGSRVSAFASANTNNGKGISSIGYNSFVFSGVGLNASVLDQLSLLSGIKVLNASWYSSISSIPPTITSSLYDEIINDRKIVVVVAAGNGQDSGTQNPNDYYLPASYKDVISVSSIGHENKLTTANNGNQHQYFLDRHEYLVNGQIRSHQHNDSIDIVAPGYWMSSVAPHLGNTGYAPAFSGTSFATPIVAGTVALMFDVNYCIEPKEVETILKLTAVKIDHLPQNIQYYGKLGAGKLDAYEAVKMAKDMADTFGTVEVKDRILYRWFYKLETAPYEIKMSNNDVTGNARLKFKARNNIEILSGDYYPDSGGYIDLIIDETLALDCPPPPSNSSSKKANTKDNNIQGNTLESSELLVFPNPTTGILNIINRLDLKEISITDITGKMVYYIKDINSKEMLIDISKFNSGIYFLKMKMKTGEISIRKIIKN